jgi:hypothetical protein
MNAWRTKRRIQAHRAWLNKSRVIMPKPASQGPARQEHGASRMGFYPFLWLSAIGAALWVGTCLVAGAVLHQQIYELVPRVSHYTGWVTSVIVLLLTGYMAMKWFELRRRAAASPVPCGAAATRRRPT